MLFQKYLGINKFTLYTTGIFSLLLFQAITKNTSIPFHPNIYGTFPSCFLRKPRNVVRSNSYIFLKGRPNTLQEPQPMNTTATKPKDNAKVCFLS